MGWAILQSPSIRWLFSAQSVPCVGREVIAGGRPIAAQMASGMHCMVQSTYKTEVATTIEVLCVDNISLLMLSLIYEICLCISMMPRSLYVSVLSRMRLL